MKKTILLAVLCAALLLVVSCAAGPNPYADTSGQNEPAGFFMGLWHGAIVIITFIVGIFTDQVNIYEVHNTGNWYNFGFLIGLLFAVAVFEAATGVITAVLDGISSFFDNL